MHLSVNDPPNWTCAPSWPELDGAAVTFIRQWNLSDLTDTLPAWLPPLNVFVFGGRRPCPEYDGFTIEYKIIAHNPVNNTHAEHHLYQRRCIPYCEDCHTGEKESVSRLPRKIELPFLKRKPRWQKSKAQWPTANGELMLFIDQTFTPENDVTSTHLSSHMIYLFAAAAQNRPVQFAIFKMDIGVQSAEAHYKAEELIWALESTRWSNEAICDAIHQGDAYMHNFMLEHSGITPFALRELARNGRNKAIRIAAQKALSRS